MLARPVDVFLLRAAPSIKTALMGPHRDHTATAFAT